MILLCLLLLGAPPVAPTSAVPPSIVASPDSGTPIDWANHAFAMFTLRNGIAEMRDYPMDGPHDYSRWTLDRADPVDVGGKPHTLVLIQTLYSAPRVSRESLMAYLFKGRTQIGDAITVPTSSARIAVKGDVVIGRWRVGKERFVERWRITDKGLISFGKTARLRPRGLGH